MRRRNLGRELADLGAFTVGVLIGERLFGRPGFDTDEPRIRAIWRDEIGGIEGELGRINDVFVGVIARRLLFGDRRLPQVTRPAPHGSAA